MVSRLVVFLCISCVTEEVYRFDQLVAVPVPVHTISHTIGNTISHTISHTMQVRLALTSLTGTLDMALAAPTHLVSPIPMHIGALMIGTGRMMCMPKMCAESAACAR